MSSPVALAPKRESACWPDNIDVDELIRNGWQPTPLRQFILKVHSRCNLACDYCYMYEMADQSWKNQPLRMSDDVLHTTASRIAEHAVAHDLSSVDIVFHGGEPLLVGSEFLQLAAKTLRDALPADATLNMTVQTNGLMINEDLLRLLSESNIGVGVSLDGARDANDKHRRTLRGTGSYDRVARSLELFATDEFRHLFRGLLCTIDITHDPITTYEALIAFCPPSIDFLLPLGNWTTRPPARSLDTSETPYADWLIPIFDRWYSGSPKLTSVRYFDNLLRLILGGDSSLESIGTSKVCLAVVEVDGSIGQVDALRSTFEGGTVTGLDVKRHSFDHVLLHPAVVARQLGTDGLSSDCRSCAIRDICGGGYYPHRYDAKNGFLNPSVYCPDLMKLITHAMKKVLDDVDRGLNLKTTRTT